MHQRPKLLLVNGIMLGAIGALQFVFDFAAYWFDAGPTASALHDNLYTLGFAEAHGLATIFAALLILRRNDGWPGWHLAAAIAHTLLGTCNLVFWPIFAEWGLVPMGVISTAMHVVFVVLQLWAYLVRGPIRV